MRRLSFITAIAFCGAMTAACSGSDEAEVAPAVRSTANCVQPTEPNVPDGRTASFDDMSAAARSVAEYLYDAQRYKDCLEAGGDFNTADSVQRKIVSVDQSFDQSKAAFQLRNGG
ncbi:MAG: hypothetical protein AAFQ73_13380 [Pseudomonadota bacterium]